MAPLHSYHLLLRSNSLLLPSGSPHLTSPLPKGEVLRSHPEQVRRSKELFISLAVVFIWVGVPWACSGSGREGAVILSRQSTESYQADEKQEEVPGRAASPVGTPLSSPRPALWLAILGCRGKESSLPGPPGPEPRPENQNLPLGTKSSLFFRNPSICIFSVTDN